MDLNHIEQYWINEAFESYKSADALYRKKRYPHALFFLHLAVEKMIKGLYVNKCKTEAPFGHNLTLIASKIDSVNFPDEIIELFSEINNFNIASRYDDYKKSFYEICDKNYTKNYLKRGKELLSWLKSRYR